jgi:hypothetical protein
MLRYVPHTNSHTNSHMLRYVPYTNSHMLRYVPCPFAVRLTMMIAILRLQLTPIPISNINATNLWDEIT